MHVIPPLSGHELFLVLFQFAFLLLAARGLGELMGRLGWPPVVGELLAGFVIGPTLLGNLAPGLFEWVFPPDREQFHLIEVVSWLGVIMLLIVTGLEIDTSLILRRGRQSIMISLGGIVVPFAAGMALGWALPDAFVAKPDQRVVFALFLGTAMSISAIAVIAKVLIELGMIRREIGQVMLAAGMVDDALGWILLSVVSGVAASGRFSFPSIGKSLLAVGIVFAVAFTLGRRVVRSVFRYVDNHIGGDMAMISALMLLALLVGSITHLLHLEAVLGAFLVGMLVGEVKRFDHRLRHIFEQLSLGVFAPVFFALAGIRVNLVSLAHAEVALAALAVLGIAIGGKFVGAYLGAKLGGRTSWEGLACGAGMNARGALEIIVATIGLSLGVLTPSMYSIILMISVVTSLMTPPLMRWTLQRVEMSDEERERLETEERRRTSFVASLKRVLLPTRGGANSQLAARVLAQMLTEEEVEVTRLYVTTNGQGGGGRGNGDAPAAAPEVAEPDRAEYQQEAVIERLSRIENHFRDVRTVERVTDDGIAPVVLEEAERYDLIVLGGTERLGRQRGPLFSEVVDHIIQGAPCPVMVVALPRDDEPELGVEKPPALDLRHILLPVRGSDSDRVAAEVAFSIARERDIVVDVLHVVTRPEHTRRVQEDESIDEAVDMGEDVVDNVAELGRTLGTTVRREVIVAERAEEAIVEYASEHSDLIVMTSSTRPISHRAFFGHGTDHILREAPCPVVVVSPD